MTLFILPPPKKAPRQLRIVRGWLQVAMQREDLSVRRVGQLTKLVRGLHYDQALICGRWQVEYLYLANGYPHYRFYCGTQMIGVIDIRTSTSVHGADVTGVTQLPEIHHDIAKCAIGHRMAAIIQHLHVIPRHRHGG